LRGGSGGGSQRWNGNGYGNGGRYNGGPGGAGRQGRTGMMDKEREISAAAEEGFA
jgi:hypothetical protein